mgnify:FL=1
MVNTINIIFVYGHCPIFNTQKPNFMNTISKNQNRLGVYCNLLPNETLLGIKTINCTVKCEDEKFRPFYGLEIGFLFLTIQFTYVSWKI